MGTLTAKYFIDKASIQLLDQGNTRWTRAELLGWVNDAQRQITVMSPNATNKVAVVKLDPGTRQNIPADGWTLLDIIRYMGTTGTTPGRVPRIISQQILNDFNPNWHAATPVTVPLNYVYDQQDQTVYYVYPPSNGKGYLQINYSPVPADVNSESNLLSVNDIFQTAVLDYVLYRANSKDAEYAPGLALAGGYLQTFMATMAAKSDQEIKNSPNQQLDGVNPDKPGGGS
jgi:hypothetical protein